MDTVYVQNIHYGDSIQFMIRSKVKLRVNNILRRLEKNSVSSYIGLVKDYRTVIGKTFFVVRQEVR